MRGTLALDADLSPVARFIPADAGNILLIVLVVAGISVHPRGCGEHAVAMCSAMQSCGSSPRMRGTCAENVRCSLHHRFIPADAGNILPHPADTSTQPVHPRGCGEHIHPGFYFYPTDGSSPRMRGTCYRWRHGLAIQRFIPADAGNILPTKRATMGIAVHPRGCGEHRIDSIIGLWCSGSSPRMRGTYRACQEFDSGCRFIPADAGNIVSISFASASSSVHPRGCGEHMMGSLPGPLWAGSSPRMRGTSVPCAGSSGLLRFIPADAGNIRQIHMERQSVAVHPRGCGEHIDSGVQFVKDRGSSPRMRGTC